VVHESRHQPRADPTFSAPVSSIPSRVRWWQISFQRSSNSPRLRSCTTWRVTTPRDCRVLQEILEGLHGKGSVVAYESFTTKDTDFSSQLTKIINSGAQVLFTPQYYNEVALIVQQAHQLGWKKPIVGSDSWGSAETGETLRQRLLRGFFQHPLRLPRVRPVRPRRSSTGIRQNTAMCRRCGRAHLGLHAARSTGDPEHRRAHGRSEKGPRKCPHRDVPDVEDQPGSKPYRQAPGASAVSRRQAALRYSAR